MKIEVQTSHVPLRLFIILSHASQKGIENTSKIYRKYYQISCFAVNRWKSIVIATSLFISTIFLYEICWVITHSVYMLEKTSFSRANLFLIFFNLWFPFGGSQYKNNSRSCEKMKQKFLGRGNFFWCFKNFLLSII